MHHTNYPEEKIWQNHDPLSINFARGMYNTLRGTTVVIRKDEAGEEREVRVVLEVDQGGGFSFKESEVKTVQVDATELPSLQPGLQLEPTANLGHVETNA